MRQIKMTTLQSLLVSIFTTSLLSGCGSSLTTSQPEPVTTESAAVTLAWDGSFASPGVLDPSVTGYRLYYGLSPHDYTDAVDVHLNLQATLNNLPRTRVYFAVTAYNAQKMESEFSDEVSADLATNAIVVLNLNQ